MADTVIYEKQDAVAIISMNRPDALNGFTTALRESLLHAFEKAHRDESVRVVVFTGEGRAFSAGADLKTGFEGERTTQEQLLFEYAPVLVEISQIPKPVIAAVPGFAAGIIEEPFHLGSIRRTSSLGATLASRLQKGTCRR